MGLLKKIGNWIQEQNSEGSFLDKAKDFAQNALNKSASDAIDFDNQDAIDKAMDAVNDVTSKLKLPRVETDNTFSVEPTNILFIGAIFLVVVYLFKKIM